MFLESFENIEILLLTGIAVLQMFPYSQIRQSQVYLYKPQRIVSSNVFLICRYYSNSVYFDYLSELFPLMFSLFADITAIPFIYTNISELVPLIFSLKIIEKIL
ncbi:hypothetical protein M9Y10_028960 [Tritrichomonas musculus]|uniref:Uncharacterized protein n=1 Tax=Tritrichomonas musculus TaxID=1915356 RepID=A0ABR2KP25_9EUKA